MELRAATLDDIDEITEVVCTAMPMDPQWDYRLPRRKEFPEDTWQCTRRDYAGVLSEELKHKLQMNVITFPSDEDKQARKIIAVAVWELVIHQYSTEDGMARPDSMLFGLVFELKLISIHDNVAPCDERRDADFPRMKAFIDALRTSKKELFDDVYGNYKLHLDLLCTLPKYQRRGAGTMHCNWCLNLAKERKKEVTLFASPMGQGLYDHLGFEVRGTVIVQMNGEDEKLIITAMAFHTRGVPKVGETHKSASTS